MAGRERQVGHRAVIDDVQVDDRGRSEVAQLGGVRQRALGQQFGRVVVRHGQHDRVGVHAVAVEGDGKAGGARLDLFDPCPRPHVDAGALERVRSGVAVQLLKRNGCVPDVARLGRLEQTGLEDLGREGERRLGGRKVHGRKHDQVPERVHGGR